MKICFWGNVASALNGTTNGGGELQISLLAKGLVKCGHEVVVVDYNATRDFVSPEGIKVFKINGWDKGIRIIRTITHRLPGLYKSLKDQKADVYYCRIRDFRHILAYWAARKVNGKFIIQMASDLDAMSFKTKFQNKLFTSIGDLFWFFNSVLVEIVYPFLLRNADLVLVQHEGQKRILEERNIKSTLFLNLYELKIKNNYKTRTHKDFIYVGWLDKRKGFPKFFELVQKSPSKSFKVIGPPRDNIGYHYFEKFKSFPNVTLLGELSHSETVTHIADSLALISTSPMEGFPNIFIEAWACGIPVLSLNVDPGNVIEKENLGVIVHGDLNKLIESLVYIMPSEEFAEKAKRYVENNHALNARKEAEINTLFNELYNQSDSKRN